MGKKKKNTEEEILEYFYGEEFVNSQQQHDSFLKKIFAKQDNDESEEFKKTRRLIKVIWIITVLLIVVFCTVIFYPRSLAFVGIIKKPAIVEVMSSQNAKDITVTVDKTSILEWKDTDWFQTIPYTVTNNSDKYAYIKVDFRIMDSSNQELEKMTFIPIKEVLAPQETVTGVFVWDKTLSLKAKRTLLVWNISWKDSNIFENEEESTTTSETLISEDKPVVPETILTP